MLSLPVLLLALPAAAQTPLPMPKLPVDQWFAEQDHAEAKWKVKVLPAKLTYEQRQMVLFEVTIDAGKLQSKNNTRHELQMFTRVGDGQHWITDVTYNHFDAEQLLDKHEDIMFTTAAYVKPGHYVLGAVLYDTVMGFHNVKHLPFDVSAIKDDPLPHADDAFPPAEFVAEGHVPFLGPVNLSLPLNTARPINLDVIVNFTPSSSSEGGGKTYRANAGIFLEITHVLSQLQLTNGCVWITGVDLNGLRMMFEREPAENLDWEMVRAAAAASSDAASVDVNTLAQQRDEANFLRTTLEKLLEKRPPACPAAARNVPTLPVYLLTGSSMVFPSGAERAQLTTTDCHCLFYHFRGLATEGDSADEIGKMLQPLESHEFSIKSPTLFRQALANVLQDVQQATKAQ